MSEPHEEKIEALEKRIAVLEASVRTLMQHTNCPHGKFAHLGGIERRPARSFEGSQKVDLSAAYGKTGKLVRKGIVPKTDSEGSI